MSIALPRRQLERPVRQVSAVGPRHALTVRVLSELGDDLLHSVKPRRQAVLAFAERLLGYEWFEVSADPCIPISPATATVGKVHADSTNKNCARWQIRIIGAQ